MPHGDIPNKKVQKIAPEVRQRIVDDAVKEFYIKHKPDTHKQEEVRRRSKIVYDKTREVAMQIRNAAGDDPVFMTQSQRETNDKSMYMTLVKLFENELVQFNKEELIELQAELLAGVLLEDLGSI